MAATKSTATPEVTEPKVLPRWRRILVVVLLVLGVILAPLSVFAVWTNGTMLNTDQYVDTIAPLAEDPVITDRIATRAVESLLAQVDLDQEITEALPDRAAPLAPAISQAVAGLATDVAQRFLESDQFATLWRELNRRAHDQVRNVLTGEGKRLEAGGKVVVQLGPVVETIRTKLEGLGLDIFSDASGGTRVSNQFVLFQSDDLEAVQGGVDLLQSLAVVLPILTVLLIAAAVALSGNRRKTLLRAALGVAFMMALLLIGFNVLRSVFVDAFRPEGQAAGGAVYDQLLGFLRLSVRALFALGVVVAIGAWLAGPGSLAVRTRAGFQRLMDGTAGEGSDEVSAVSSAVAGHRNPLRVLVVGLGAVLLMVLSRPSGVTVLVVALLVLFGLIVIEVLARGARRAEAAASA